ncbi:MAG: protoporphyrinogen IX oxidase [Myxococcales bacterium]|nr:protoporphyrinogen IX oxidase [Myxococcales bacterium]|tara:strand:+ start:523 stop:1062 length:540 start_codon:yes stop_codon:yes gene_type:complete
MSHEVIKALHIIGFTCWFAGLFYVVRLYIYHVEALSEGTDTSSALSAQLAVMQRRLWLGITWPAMVFTLVFGGWLLVSYIQLHGEMHGWLHLKLTLVLFLVGYHLLLGRIRKALLNNACRWSPKSLRILNEVATVFLVFIVFVGVLKNTFTLQMALMVGGVLGAVLILGFWAYHRRTAG